MSGCKITGLDEHTIHTASTASRIYIDTLATNFRFKNSLLVSLIRLGIAEVV